MRLNEIFYSIQGEGLQAGLPTVFIRTSGCSLRCTWCDTAYAFYDGEEVPVSEVVARAEEHPARRACVTGGEPLDQAESLDLVRALLERGWEVVVETSGSRDVAAVDRLEPRDRLLISMDVKCPSSAMQHRNRFENLPALREHDQLKFVIANEEDYAYALDVYREHRKAIRCPVIFQPVFGTEMCWLAERILEDGVDARLGMQLHKAIWGEAPGV